MTNHTLTTAKIGIRFARIRDLSKCLRFDHIASRSIVQNKIAAQEIIVAEKAKAVIGYLRLEYLWSKIPYIGLIIVEEEFRNRGVGQAMLRFLENYLRKKGYEQLLSSSQANEPRPQHWQRRMAFEECGLIAGINEGGVGEVFFRKRLNE